MYRSDHINKYRVLPISMDHAFSDLPNGKYSPYFIINDDSDQIRCFTAHRHEAMELIYIQEGILHAEIEDRTIVARAGDLIIVNPFMDHAASCFFSEGKMRYQFLQFELSSFMPPRNSILHECMRHLLDGSGHFREIVTADEPLMSSIICAMNRLYERWKSGEATLDGDCMQISLIYELISYLIAGFYVDNPIAGNVSRDLHFIRLVVDYMNEHYTEDISTSVISEALSYNINHFCRAFRANFGTSFTRYLCEYRLMQAMDRYRDSKMMINEISAAVGFHDYGYFAQTFKKYTGISPAAFFLGRASKHGA